MATPWSDSLDSRLARIGMRAGDCSLVASRVLSSPESSSCTKARPVTPWKPSVAKVEPVTGADSSSAMRTSTLPVALGSKPIAITLPTGTPR